MVSVKTIHCSLLPEILPKERIECWAYLAVTPMTLLTASTTLLTVKPK